MENQQRKLFLVYSLNTFKDESARIRPGKKLYFSSIEKAEETIFKFKDLFTFLFDDLHNEHVYCLVIEEFKLDSPYRSQLSTRVYSPDGRKLSECMVPDEGPFFGRAESLIHHEIGSVVEMPYGDQLIFGIVIGQPMSFNENACTYGLTASDDCYTVIHHQSMELNYAHSPMVFKPTREVSEEVRADLMLAYQNIVTRES